MAPQARCKLPPELGGLMRRDMEAVIHQANLGREDEKIAQLYFVEKLPQVDVATELYLGRATVQRRLPGIVREMQRTNCITEISAEKSALIFYKTFEKLLTFTLNERIIEP